jgi:hypothetical protein
MWARRIAKAVLPTAGAPDTVSVAGQVVLAARRTFLSSVSRPVKSRVSGGSCASGRRLCDRGIGIIVSTAGTLHATDWVAQNGVSRFRYHIDEGGQWTGDEFGLRTSPSALIMRGGRLVAAYVFHDVESLRARISADHGPARANVLGGNAAQRMEKEAV